MLEEEEEEEEEEEDVAASLCGGLLGGSFDAVRSTGEKFESFRGDDREAAETDGRIYGEGVSAYTARVGKGLGFSASYWKVDVGI